MSNKSDFKLEIVNLNEILEVLNSFDTKLKNEIATKVHMEVAKKTIKKDFKNGLPYSTESKRGISVRKAKKKTGVVTGALTKVFWLRFPEYGTKQRRTRAKSRVKYQRSGGKTPTFNRGKVKKQGRMQATVDQNINKWINIINKDYGEITQQELGKKFLQLNNKIYKKKTK